MEDQEVLDEQNSLDESKVQTLPLIYKNSLDAVERYGRCAHCHGFLHFSYYTDFGRNLTQETARCPECNQSAHRVTHRLQ